VSVSAFNFWLSTLGVDARRDRRGEDRQRRFNMLILARLLAAGVWHTARDSLDYIAVAHGASGLTSTQTINGLSDCARNAPVPGQQSLRFPQNASRSGRPRNSTGSLEVDLTAGHELR
jgi:hypothetical protein